MLTEFFLVKMMVFGKLILDNEIENKKIYMDM